MIKRSFALAGALCLSASVSHAAEHWYFTSRVNVSTTCEKVYEGLTLMPNLAKLVPHLHGSAKVAKATKPGESLSYEYTRRDGTKGKGRFLLTELTENHSVQVMVQPAEGPWLRVQDFELYPAPNQAVPECHVLYTESYNQLALKHLALDDSEAMIELREPYMQIILRRLKNIAEGKPAGTPKEVEKLREITLSFP